jgi:hypothetical protein
MQVSTSPASIPVRSISRTGVEEVGEEQAVDDEAGLVGDLDRGLAERRAPGSARSRTSAAPGRDADLDQRHSRHRVEDVKAHRACSVPGGLGDLAIESEEVVVAPRSEFRALQPPPR